MLEKNDPKFLPHQKKKKKKNLHSFMMTEIQDIPTQRHGWRMIECELLEYLNRLVWLNFFI